MKKPTFLALATIGALGPLSFAEPALAQENACASRNDVVRKLEDRFGETRTSVGIHREDAVVEVFSSAATGTWTIVITRADGMSCLLASGQRWEQFPEAVHRAPSDREA